VKVKDFFIRFVIIFILTLVTGSVVSYLYSLIAHGAGVADWPSAFRLAITFAFILSVIPAVEEARKKKEAPK